MYNFAGKIECPHCYSFEEFNSAPENKNVMLGDFVENTHVSRIETLKIKCPVCKEIFIIHAIIKQGQLTKYIPLKEEKPFDMLEFAKTNILLKGSFHRYSYYERSAYRMGEDTMFLVDLDGVEIRKDMVYPVFDELWNIDKVFKECIDPDLPNSKYQKLKNTKEKNFICEVFLENGTKRILILREGYFPTLRAFSWNSIHDKVNHDCFKKLSTYTLPENNILVVCGTR